MNIDFSKLYNQLTGHTLNEALFAFEQLDIRSARSGDLYFESYGIPNMIELSNIPYERFIAYEYLMHVLADEDKSKFSLVHKGTPYYFLAWTAFEIRNYGKAIFYMDLALGEDIRKVDPTGKSEERITREALGNPGGNLWKLRPDGPAIRVIQHLRESVVWALKEFRVRTSSEIKVEDFVNKFVIESITKDPKNRSLISALYSYILEVKDLYETLKIRSQNLSSIEPFLSNLFKGGLIFESLLKVIADDRSWIVSRGRGSGRSPSTIEAFRRCNDFLTTFSTPESNFVTGAPDLSTVLSNAVDDTRETSFSVSAQLRNTAGHDLRRDDIFQIPDDYKTLVDKQLNAMFFAIAEGYL